MKIQDCPIEGLKVIQLDLHGDAAEFFVERFQRKHVTRSRITN